MRKYSQLCLLAFGCITAAVNTASAQSTGACCYETGGCSNTPQAGCISSAEFGNAYFQGVGTSCQTTGICRRNCCRTATCGWGFSDTCSDGRRLPPGQACEVGCTGACCETDGTCEQIGPQACATDGGAYRGNETTCAATVCGGACCSEVGQCRMSSPEACSSNDEFIGLGTSCNGLDCLGVCCQPVDGCFEVGTEEACTGSGGVFRGRGTRCAFINCSGACCLPEKGCVETTAEGCIQFFGEYQGEGTDCGIDCPSKVSNGFTYHGQLKRHGLPYSGPVALEVSLWDLPMDGQLLEGPLAIDYVPVENGLFQTVIDFGDGSFGHGTRWLQVSVCTENCTSPEAFTVLQPRQLITAVPFALQTRGIVVDENGNVGIHTTAPARELEVGGAVKTKELHLANPNGLPLARWDGKRVEPGPTQTVPGAVPTSANSSGSPAWSNPVAALVSDDVRATIVVNQTGQSQSVLRITGFNFNIPSDATVTGVVVYAEGMGSCSCTSCSGSSSSCFPGLPARIVSDGVAGASSSISLVESETTSGVLIGANSEWTPAMYNSPGFGVEIAVSTTVLVSATCGPPWQPYPCTVLCSGCSASGSASIDSVRMEIIYQGPDMVVDRQWSVGLAGNQAEFMIAPTSNLSNPAMTILTNGKIGLGMTDPYIHGYQLQLPNVDPSFNSGKGAAQARFWYTYSSRRWKENVHRIPDALEKVLHLDGVMFDWTGGGQHDVGFVAEDVAEVMPELVDMEPDGQNAAGMKYDRVTALTVEAIKELNAKLAAQEKELKALRQEKDAQVQELRLRIERLESSADKKQAHD